jgi:hypothetical protein
MGADITSPGNGADPEEMCSPALDSTHVAEKLIEPSQLEI